MALTMGVDPRTGQPVILPALPTPAPTPPVVVPWEPYPPEPAEPAAPAVPAALGTVSAWRAADVARQQQEQTPAQPAQAPGFQVPEQYLGLGYSPEWVAAFRAEHGGLAPWDTGPFADPWANLAEHLLARQEVESGVWGTPGPEAYIRRSLYNQYGYVDPNYPLLSGGGGGGGWGGTSGGYRQPRFDSRLWWRGGFRGLPPSYQRPSTAWDLSRLLY